MFAESTKVDISHVDGKLLIFEHKRDGIFLGEAICQKPFDKPNTNTSSAVKANEVELICHFLEENGMVVERTWLIERNRQGLSLAMAQTIFERNKAVEDFILEYKDIEPEGIEQIYTFVKGDMRKFEEICCDCREKAKELSYTFVDVNLVLSFFMTPRFFPSEKALQYLNLTARRAPAGCQEGSRTENPMC